MVLDKEFDRRPFIQTGSLQRILFSSSCLYGGPETSNELYLEHTYAENGICTTQRLIYNL
jgi:hypothetical protein